MLAEGHWTNCTFASELLCHHLHNSKESFVKKTNGLCIKHFNKWKTTGPCFDMDHPPKDQAHPIWQQHSPMAVVVPQQGQCTLHTSNTPQAHNKKNPSQPADYPQDLSPNPQDAKVQNWCQTSQDNCTGPMCLPWTQTDQCRVLLLFSSA